MLDDSRDVITNTTTITTTTTTKTNHPEGQSDDSGYTASSLSPFQLDFEEQEYKPTPYSIADGAGERLSLFEESSILHTPVPTPTIKSPIVLLERCDKIWNTLQLIKTMQDNDATESSDDSYEEEEKETLSLIEVGQNELHSRRQSTLRDKTVPFSFLVQKTRKLYPCVTCGKQYLERRSLRKHSERIHGVILPLLIKRRRRTNFRNKMGSYENNPVALSSNNNLERLHNNRNFYKTTRASNAVNLPMASSLKGSVAAAPCSPEKSEDSKCALCQQRVKSVRQHLINYHKIGRSSSMMRELELSLSIKNDTLPRDDRTTVTLPDKLLQMPTNIDTQEKSRSVNNKSKAHQMAEVRKKRKYTLSHINARKKPKFDMKHYASILNASNVREGAYNCEICLGVYATANSYGKHRRIHIMRGETKENFHNVKCRYFNSPYNEKNRLSTVNCTNTAIKNTNSSKNLQTNSSEKKMDGNGKTSRINQTTPYDTKVNKKNDTTCVCGRLFRDPHTLFVHKNKCRLCNDEGEMTQNAATSSDKDSGIGINITIKKRNNSYEIVGKDDDEDKLCKPNATSTSANIIESSANAHVEHQQLNTYESSEYSKDHSILKLQNINDDDEIIDIEDDIQIISDENNEPKQIIMHGDEKSNLQEKQNNNAKSMENGTAGFKVRPLKQMCQKVLDELTITRKPEDAATQREELIKANLQSLSKTEQNAEKEYGHNETEPCITKIDISKTCGYCNQQFDTVNLYNKHQCTLREGREFNEFSQHLLCFYCSEILYSFSEFDEHMKKEHLDYAHCCYYCLSKFLSDRERRRHCRIEHDDTLCRFCNKKLSVSIKALHESYHLGFGHPCHKCKKTYSMRRKLLYHNSTIHKNGAENSVICNICLRPVKLKTFRRHMYGHNNNECHFCGKVFTNRTGMEYHTLVYHRGATSKLKCNTCNTRFSSKKQLEKHEIDGCSV